MLTCTCIEAWSLSIGAAGMRGNMGRTCCGMQWSCSHSRYSPFIV